MLFVAGSLLVSSAEAQVSGTQGFRVRIPSKLKITPPAAEAFIEHDETDANQVFPAQQWDVKANARSGATVSFSTDQAFTHTVDGAYKADAKLNLAIGSSQAKANWSVTNPADQTDYGAAVPDEVAMVQAASTKAGKASFDLTVTFITVEHDALAEGDYTLTVTGTLSAN
jgi:hypothetical protein